MASQLSLFNRSLIWSVTMAVTFFFLVTPVAFGQYYNVPSNTGVGVGYQDMGGVKPSQDYGTGSGSNLCFGCMDGGGNYSSDPASVKAILDSIQVRIQQIKAPTGPINAGGGAIMANPVETQSRAVVDAPSTTTTKPGFGAGTTTGNTADLSLIRSLLEEIVKRLQQLQ